MHPGLIALLVGLAPGVDVGPASLPDEPRPTREVLDLSYHESGDGLRRLNLVLPEGVKDAPLLVWIGGGAWSYVDRAMEMDLARKVASRGIAVASVGHRLSPAVWKDPALKEGVRHPAHVQDIAQAIAWLHDHAGEYPYSRANIFVGGFSSGGHLAALVSMDKRYLADVGRSREEIRGVIPIAGAYDISHYHSVFLDDTEKHMADTHVKAVFGPTEEDFKDASPTTYVGEMIVPMLLISEFNTYGYTKIFEEKIREAGFRKLLAVNVHELGHGGLWKNLSHEDRSEYRDLVVDYIRDHAHP